MRAARQVTFCKLPAAVSILACRYEEYLDKQITAADIFYLEDVSLARQLVELGCVQQGDTLLFLTSVSQQLCSGPISQVPWKRRGHQAGRVCSKEASC